MARADIAVSRCRGAVGRAIAAATVLLLMWPSPARSQAPVGSNLQVFLMTMGAGAEIYERFGHNAVWIRDTVAHTEAIYNYGTFGFPPTVAGSVGFAVHFMMGRPLYWLGVDSSIERERDTYRYHQRNLSVQELNLLPAQRADLAARLATNALEENRYYLYDYFRDNCSTRVRDILDRELGGALKRATVGRPAEGTLRFHTRRSIANNLFLFVGIDVAFGPRVDRPLDQWDEMFLPEKLQQRVGELRVPGLDGKPAPLVVREIPLLTLDVYHVDPAPPRWAGTFSMVGVGLGAAMFLLSVAPRVRRTNRSPRPRIRRGPVGTLGRTLTSAWLIVSGLAGLLLLFFWVFTDHVATYHNQNLFFLSPLALGVLPSIWFRGNAAPARWRGWFAWVLLGSVVLGSLITFLPVVSHQDNAMVYVLIGWPTFVAAIIALLTLESPPLGRS